MTDKIVRIKGQPSATTSNIQFKMVRLKEYYCIHINGTFTFIALFNFVTLSINSIHIYAKEAKFQHITEIESLGACIFLHICAIFSRN